MFARAPISELMNNPKYHTEIRLPERGCVPPAAGPAAARQDKKDRVFSEVNDEVPAAAADVLRTHSPGPFQRHWHAALQGGTAAERGCIEDQPQQKASHNCLLKSLRPFPFNVLRLMCCAHTAAVRLGGAAEPRYHNEGGASRPTAMFPAVLSFQRVNAHLKHRHPAMVAAICCRAFRRFIRE